MRTARLVVLAMGLTQMILGIVAGSLLQYASWQVLGFAAMVSGGLIAAYVAVTSLQFPLVRL